jgi:endonuclease/exonuclease/phosphatase family metal-dependent hydrolase
VFGVRGAIAENHHVTLGDHSRCHVVRITVDGRSLTVVLVDLESSPFQSRREWFARLEAELARLRDESIVVLGDFNTPRESVYFRSWRGRFQHAFEVAGRGFTETWPAPLPLLCLDHVWVSNDWRVLQCRKPWHPPHDHFGLVVDLGE